MLYKKASEMKPTPIPHCMGGEGTVMMERLLDAPAEMLGKGRAYVRHTLAPGVTIGRHTHEHEMESMVIVSGRAVHIINGEEQILEFEDQLQQIELLVNLKQVADPLLTYAEAALHNAQKALDEAEPADEEYTELRDALA